MNVMKRLWNDEAGFVVSVELILVATIAVVGLLTGLTAVRDAVVSELSDVAGAVQDVNQSYTYWGTTGHSAATAGSDFLDDVDFCDGPDQEAGAGYIDNCITIDATTLIQEDGVGVVPVFVVP